jgi:His/Glu/Gln/Arg/opine family amino acid ABC transporter permease subunit
MTNTSALWQTYLPSLLGGIVVTLQLLAISVVAGLAIGVVGALALRWGNAFVRGCVRCYVELVRGTPALVQVFIIYYGLGDIGVALPAMAAGSIALSFFGGAFFVEIVRGSIDAVDVGEVEAARALAFSDIQLLALVVATQAMRIAVPPVMNMVADLLKATALVVVIGAPDLMYFAYNASSETYRPMEILSLAGLMYFAIAFPLSSLAGHLERSLAHGSGTN